MLCRLLGWGTCAGGASLRLFPVAIGRCQGVHRNPVEAATLLAANADPHRVALVGSLAGVSSALLTRQWNLGDILVAMQYHGHLIIQVEFGSIIGIAGNENKSENNTPVSFDARKYHICSRNIVEYVGSCSVHASSIQTCC